MKAGGARTALTTFVEEDGAFWGCFVYGHVDPESLREAILYEVDPISDDIRIEQRWMHQEPEEFGKDHPWVLEPLASKGGSKSVAVTGYFIS